MQNRYWLRTLVELGIVAALLAGVGAVQARGKAIAAPAPVSVETTRAIGTDAAVAEGVFADQGVKAIVTDAPTSLSPSSAIDLARKLSPGPAAQAKSISAVHVLLTSTQHPGPLGASALVPKDLPVWMVTFRGITVERHGGIPGRPARPPMTGMSFSSFITDDGESLMGVVYRPRAKE